MRPEDAFYCCAVYKSNGTHHLWDAGCPGYGGADVFADLRSGAGELRGFGPGRLRACTGRGGTSFRIKRALIPEFTG